MSLWNLCLAEASGQQVGMATNDIAKNLDERLMKDELNESEPFRVSLALFPSSIQ